MPKSFRNRKKTPRFDCRLLSEDERKHTVPFKQETVTGNVAKYRNGNLQSSYLWAEKRGRMLRGRWLPGKQRDVLLHFYLDSTHKGRENIKYSSPCGYSRLLKAKSHLKSTLTGSGNFRIAHALKNHPMDSKLDPSVKLHLPFSLKQIKHFHQHLLP